eukprot:m51a1_g4882 hypothetical protein (347) ;mRNA; f:40282-41397
MSQPGAASQTETPAPPTPRVVPAVRPRALVRVLSIDGGGIRGIVPAVFLAFLEYKTGSRVHELFDVVVGTSTGGLVAAALTHPRPAVGGVPMWASEVVAMYRRCGADVFAHPRSNLLMARYDREGLDGLISSVVPPGTPLSDCLVPTVVSTFEMKKREAHFFKSWKHGYIPKDFALQCTTAAPTYFAPPEVPELLRASPLAGGVFIDGGVAANNPALKAYLCARVELYPDASDIVVVSLGTGCPAPRPDSRLTPSEVGDWGFFSWLRPGAGDLVGMLLDVSAQTADAHVKELLGQRYWRFQRVLQWASPDLDNAESENIELLVKEGNALVHDNQDRIASLIELLKK